ncbi:MAG: DUF4434 domain-containing protein [Lachnospiraceae bacterium]|nr:DUF4434 domain-containing protein [Lachnospiraceae bacterium]
MSKKGPITGTFIDEITYDIPSSNWSLEQWRSDFDNMQDIGIDTVIFIRGGLEDKSIFPSKVLDTPYADDFAGFVFEETSKRGMDVFLGMYISNLNWNGGDAHGEIRKNMLFTNEAYKRYGHYPSFKGWYIPQEQSHNCLNFAEIMRGMSAICKDKTPDKKVLISPFFHTQITADKGFFTPEQHAEEWEKLFSYGGRDIDICAFQDGTAPMDKMDEFYMLTAELCKKYDIEHWVNAETFERDVRCMYYPITFSLLKRRLEHHKKYAEKIITFEFSHFLSPQSIYPSAQNLNHLYKEFYLK